MSAAPQETRAVTAPGAINTADTYRAPAVAALSHINRKKAMRLDRNENEDGKGKYALIKLRAIPGNPQTAQELAAAILANPECVDWGTRHSDSEFFLIRLKDKYAAEALHQYANAAALDGNTEWSLDVYAMAKRAERHPGQKKPD